MPKRPLPPAVTAPVAALVAPPPLSPLVQLLRTDWRWAAISQFLWMFSDAFGLVDWDIEVLEADLDGDETALLPDIIAKMLYALTYNRQINRDNAMENLRKQYLKRVPEGSPLGTLEEPVEWATLGLRQKVEILWTLCEWQMEDAARFRALLKSEDDSTSWRIDPVGWDKPGNTYYLFDDNRLWIQRAPPVVLAARPPKKTSQKAKREARRARAQADPATKKAEADKKKSHRKREVTPKEELPPTPAPEDVIMSGPRKRTQVAFYGNPTPTAQALKRAAPAVDTPTRSTRNHPLRETREKEPPAQPEPVANGGRSSRSGRASLPRAPVQSSSKIRRKAPPPPSTESSELTEDESELSDLPDEEDEEPEQANGKSASGTETPLTPLESTRESSELSEEVLPPPSPRSDKDFEPADEDEEGDLFTPPAVSVKDEPLFDEFVAGVEEAKSLPDGFVEWEAVCVSLYDWRTFPEQFAKSRHPDEKALYRVLTEQVGPTVIEALMVKEQERLKQEAINNRKRSSRIATRELEKEEIARREQAQREMEERMERSRREEARKEREEQELIAREKAREDRLKEREERIAARENAIVQKALAEQEAKESAIRARERRLQRRERGEPDYDSDAETGSGAVTPAARVGEPRTKAVERWELNCEVCKKTGWNLDDEEDVVCCDGCNRWQHVECHDRLDMAEGRPKRNWEKVDFKCRDCRRKAARDRPRHSDPAMATVNPRPLNAHGAPSLVVRLPNTNRSLPPAHQPSPHQPPPHPSMSNGHAPHYPPHPQAQHQYYGPPQYAYGRPPHAAGPPPSHYPPNPYLVYQNGPPHQYPSAPRPQQYSPQSGSHAPVPRPAYPPHPSHVQHQHHAQQQQPHQQQPHHQQPHHQGQHQQHLHQQQHQQQQQHPSSSRPPPTDVPLHQPPRQDANGHPAQSAQAQHAVRPPAKPATSPPGPSQVSTPAIAISHSASHPFAPQPHGYRPEMRYPPYYGPPGAQPHMHPQAHPSQYPPNGMPYRPHPPPSIPQGAYGTPPRPVS